MKNAISFNSTIVSTASAAYFPETLPRSVAADPTSTVAYEPGSVVIVDDAEAPGLFGSGFVVEWDPEVHGATPREILGRMRSAATASARQSSETSRV